jgi:hypothetical protein
MNILEYTYLKLYRESWPNFEQVTKKVPTPRTLEPSAFDEKSTFDFCSLLDDKASLAFFSKRARAAELGPLNHRII